LGTPYRTPQMAAKLVEQRGAMNDLADGGPTAFVAQVARPTTDEAEVSFGFEWRHQHLEQDSDGFNEAAGLFMAQYRNFRAQVDVGKKPGLPLALPMPSSLSTGGRRSGPTQATSIILARSARNPAA
jgi:hypothetical protein